LYQDVGIELKQKTMTQLHLNLKLFAA